MRVTDQLTGLGAAHGKAQTIDHVIQTGLQDRQQVITGDARLLVGHLEVVTELALQHAVIALGLLLLAQLQAILGQLLVSSIAVHARSIRTTLQGALIRIAAIALQEELLALSAAQAANCSGISCHNLLTSYSN